MNEPAVSTPSHKHLPRKLVGARFIENRHRVDLGIDGESDARLDIGLNGSFDDVGGRPLRRHNQVNAGGAGLLGETLDIFLDRGRGHKHQVRELVDNDNYVRQGGNPGVFLCKLVIGLEVAAFV